MFNRREKLGPLRRLSRLLWPAMGWRRTGYYLKHRIGRLPGSPYQIAAGFACGAAISFSPFVGLHFIIGGIWAWLFKSNIISSAIGTVIGNPWTFPFIWTWIYHCGVWMGAGSGSKSDSIKELDLGTLFANIFGAMLAGDIKLLVDTAGPVFWPMLIGSLPTMCVIWLVFYFLLKAMVESYQKGRILRRGLKIKEKIEMPNVEKEEGIT